MLRFLLTLLVGNAIVFGLVGLLMLALGTDAPGWEISLLIIGPIGAANYIATIVRDRRDRRTLNRWQQP